MRVQSGGTGASPGGAYGVALELAAALLEAPPEPAACAASGSGIPAAGP